MIRISDLMSSRGYSDLFHNETFNVLNNEILSLSIPFEDLNEIKSIVDKGLYFSSPGLDWNYNPAIRVRSNYSPAYLKFRSLSSNITSFDFGSAERNAIIKNIGDKVNAKLDGLDRKSMAFDDLYKENFDLMELKFVAAIQNYQSASKDGKSIYSLRQDFEIINRKFFVPIRKNLEAINRNYQSVKQVEDKVDITLSAMLKGFESLGRKIDDKSNEINENIKNLREFVRNSRIEDVTSKLITFIQHFITEQSTIRQLTEDQLINELEGSDNVLNRLKEVRTPGPNTLHSNLFDIINQRFAIPENKDDKIAFTALDLLYSGILVYISVMIFTIQGSNYLANYYYKKNDIENYNRHLTTLSGNLKAFVSSLNGAGGYVGLLDKVLSIFEEVRNLDFMQEEREDILESLSRRKDALSTIKSKLDHSVKDLPEQKPPIGITYDFKKSNMSTPIGEWEDQRRVSYAIQFVDGDQKYSQVSRWSRSYRVFGKANPFLNIGTDSQGRKRLIFRKFDNSNPELVGIVEDSHQRQFRDINHDLYKAVLEPNELIAIDEIKRLIKGGGDVNAEYPNKRRILHAAAENFSMNVTSILISNEADINAMDKSGRSPIHIGLELDNKDFVKYLIAKGANVNTKSNLNWTPLHVAVYKNHEDLVRLLLENDADVNSKTQGGFTPLHMAASFGSGIIIDALYRHTEIDVNARSDEGLTALHLASIGGHFSAIQVLLKNSKVNLNAKAKGDLTPMHFVSASGILDIVKYLYEKGADLLAADSEGNYPIHISALMGQLDVVKYFIEHNVEINITSTKWPKYTPLHCAAEKGRLEVLKYLIGKNANLEALDVNKFTPLHVAAENNNLDVVKNLIHNKANLEAKDVFGFTPLYAAVYKGHLEVVKYLVNNKADLKTKDVLKSTPLHLAAENGHLEMAKYLVENKADLEAKTVFGFTPLLLAAKIGNFEVVKYLIQNKADLEAKGNFGCTPLNLAAENGHIEVVKYLVDNKADFGARDVFGSTSLHLAAYMGQLEVVRYLIADKKANLEDQNTRGYTPLHLAASQGNMDVVKYLIGKKANLEIKTLLADTPLHLAAENGNLEVVKYLIGKKVDLEIQGRKGYTALHYAAEHGKIKVVKYLVEIGASIDKMGNNGKTALDVAREENKTDVVLYLIQKAKASDIFEAVRNGKLDEVKYFIEDKLIDIDSTDLDGKTALNLAASEGKLDVVKYLHDKGADLLIADISGASPIHSAALSGHLDIVKYLTNSNVDINVKMKNKIGQTPLHSAASFGELEVVKYLIDKKVDRDAVDNFGFNALHLAAGRGHLNVVEFLVRIGMNVNAKSKSAGGITPLDWAASSGYLNVVEYLVDNGASIEDLDWASALILAKKNNHLHVVNYLKRKKSVRSRFKRSYNFEAVVKNGPTLLQNFAIDDYARNRTISEIESASADNAKNDIYWTSKDINSFAMLTDFGLRLLTGKKRGYVIGLFAMDRIMENKLNDIEKSVKKAITNGFRAYSNNSSEFFF